MIDRNKNKLIRKITKLQFVLYDISLFLDTHPKDGEALKHYKIYESKLDELVKEYERLYGAQRGIRGDAWTWVEGPWPWEREFNEV